MGGEVLDAASGGVHVEARGGGERVIGHDEAAGPGRGLEVAVEVVERQDLDVHQGALGAGHAGAARAGDTDTGCHCHREYADKSAGTYERHSDSCSSVVSGPGRPSGVPGSRARYVDRVVAVKSLYGTFTGICQVID